METTKEERDGWASPVQHVSNSPRREAEKWKKAALALIRDVDTLEEALRRDICPGHVDVPPPETACEFGARRCNEARATLAPKP